MYYYNRNRRFDFSKIFDLKKVTVCIVIIILVLIIKKTNLPFRDLALSRIDYYLFNYTYSYDELVKSVGKIPYVAEGLPVFKQSGAKTLFLPVEGGQITSTFGMRMHPVLKVERMHNGIDIVHKEGTPIKSALDGRVSVIGNDNELGRYVKIIHDGGLETVYCHMKDVYVKQSEEVKQGFIIGTIGKTGLAETPHLHFEVWQYNKPQDPLEWIKMP